MTPTEFHTRMQALARDPDLDNEEKHRACDKLMHETLTYLGYGDGIRTFRSINPWYQTWRKIDILAVTVLGGILISLMARFVAR